MSGSIMRFGWKKRVLVNWRDYYLQPTGHVSEQRRKWLIPEQFHYNAWIAERSKALISDYRSQDQPFFLWASFFDPHPKYLAPEPWDTMYGPVQNHRTVRHARRAREQGERRVA